MFVKGVIVLAAVAIAKATFLSPTLRFAEPAIDIAAAPALARVDHFAAAPVVTSAYRTEVVSAPAVKYAVASAPVVSTLRAEPSIALASTALHEPLARTLGVSTHIAAPLPLARGCLFGECLGHNAYAKFL